MANDMPVASEEVGEEIAVLIRTNGLDNLTPKNIRAHLAQKFNVDFSEHKKAVDELTLEKIKDFQKKQSRSEPAGNTNSAASDDSSDESVLDDGPSTAKSKAKKRRSIEAVDGDEDDDLMSRVKRRRGASAPKPRKTATKKVKDENAPKKRTAFTKICALSDELTEMLGRRYMTRSDVVSCMWSYFRENGLMDPKDKRWVRCDSKLKELCKKDRVLAFGVMKFMTPYITEAKFDTEEERLRVENDVDEFQRMRKAEKEKSGKGAATSSSVNEAATATPTPDVGDEVDNTSVTSNSQDQADDENESQDTEEARQASESSGSDSGDDDESNSGSASADEESN